MSSCPWFVEKVRRAKELLMDNISFASIAVMNVFVVKVSSVNVGCKISLSLLNSD
jgi:hypothetical protein